MHKPYNRKRLFCLITVGINQPRKYETYSNNTETFRLNRQWLICYNFTRIAKTSLYYLNILFAICLNFQKFPSTMLPCLLKFQGWTDTGIYLEEMLIATR